MSDLNIALILRLVDQVTAPARAVMQNLGQMGAQTQQFGQAQMAAGAAMHAQASSNVAAMRGQALGVAALATSLYGVIRPAVQFEQAMAQVGAVANTTAREQELLTRTARDLGERTSFSASQAADGMQYLAMAGFDVNRIVGAMPGVLNLAAAAGAQLGETANISSNILSGFGLEADEMGRVGDVLVNTFTSSNTTLMSLGAAMSYAAPAARAAGLDLEYVAAMAGRLGDNGIAGERAGTALRAMMARLAGPSNAAADALRELNVVTADADGNLRNLPDILRDLDEATRDMGSAARADLMNVIFGMEAANAASILMGEAGTGALQSYAESLRETGSAARVAERMNDTAAGAVRRLNSASESAAIALGNGLLPVLAELAEGLIPMIQLSALWVGANQELVTQVGWVVAGLLGVRIAALAVRAAFWLLFGWVGQLRWAFGAMVAGAGLLMRGFAGARGAALFLALGFHRALVAAASLAGTIAGFLVARLLAFANGAAVLATAALRGIGAAAVWLGRTLAIAGRALLTNPFFLAIAGIAAAVYVIYDNWDGIVEWFQDKIARVAAAFDTGLLNGVLALIAEFNPFTLMAEAALGLWTYLTGWTWDDLSAGLAAAFDIDLGAAGAALIRSLWDGMLSVLDQMVASVRATLVSIVPDWLIEAWNWTQGGGEVSSGSGGRRASRASGARAIGGPVRPGFVYEINENGTEYFQPDVPGRVLRAGGLGLSGGRGGVQIGDIHIHAQPGMDPEAIARAVRRELARLTEPAGLALHDGGIDA